jgi:hypothetical protein
MRGEERSYIPEQKDVLALGQARQLCHPDACAHLELGEPADTITCYSQKGIISHDNYCLQVVGQGRNVPRCNWARRCAEGTASRLA